MAVFTKKGKKFDTTGEVLYGPVRPNNVFKGFGGNCESANNGDAVVRYDQLADRWLIVMPLFSPRPPATRSSRAGAGRTAAAERARRRGPTGSGGDALSAAAAGSRRRRHPHRASAAAPAARPRRSRRHPGPYSMCYAVSAGAGSAGSVLSLRVPAAALPGLSAPGGLARRLLRADEHGRRDSDGDTEKHACVVDRAKMLKGEPATEQCVIIDDVNFLNNADLDGKALPPAGAPNIMMAAGGTQLEKILEDDGIYVWQFHVDWKDPSKTEGDRPDEDCRRAVSLPVRRPADELRAAAGHASAGSTRRATRSWRGSSIAGSAATSRSSPSHSVNTAAAAAACAGTSSESTTRPQRARLYQQGTYAPDGFYRWMASPAIDKFGNIGIGYSFGGTPNFAGQRFAGRTPAIRPAS